MEGKSVIADFFNGKSVFITGATGFVGKAVVEKLLRSCPGIKHIFVLVRAKKGCEGKERVKSILSCPLFDRLKSETPGAVSKVCLINGDITQPQLGISPEDAAILHEEVSVIIHSAATVKFDEALKTSIKINVEGTRQIIDLAKQMKRIEAVVHVSTAYSNCERRDIEEIIYPIDIDPNDAIHTFNWMSEDLVNAIAPKIIEGKPNTYTYTKHVAEKLVDKSKDEVPICIVRPSIVAATYEDPMPGWVDNMNGPSGIFVACGKGVLRSLLCYADNKLDVIPLDYVVSLIIAAAWHTASDPKMSGAVYNCCSGDVNPFYLQKLVPHALDAFWHCPFDKIVWYPSPGLTTSPTWNYISEFFQMYVPAQLVDFISRLRGKELRLMYYYYKVKQGVLALRYFCTHEWNFKTHNTVALFSRLPPTDQKIFRFNIKDVDWFTYVRNYMYGLRRYALKEDDCNILEARKSCRKMYALHRGTQTTLCLLAIMVLGFVLSYIIRIFAN